MSEFAGYLEKLASMDDDALAWEIVTCRYILADYDQQWSTAREMGGALPDIVVEGSLVGRTRLRLAERALSRREVSTYGVCATADES